MSSVPNIMKLGMAMAFIGAIIAFVAMAYAWDGTVESAPNIGVCMAVATIFFAVAGSFSTYSPVKDTTVFVLSLLTIAFSILGGVYGAIDPVITVFLAIIGAVCVFCANSPVTSAYIEEARII